ncbi:hypothetical protein Kfla_1368 [Kribbella flavida DSM 17836]|uniref:Uncharacterized protein n=1 Tax=Kribbella flavida (strain DSM 17836 / JCM 10339 / NBRC 14399) TaxID=479435 RepID=D2PKF8_KRIFD|nr:hypothetical protein [Kribbella flavida]ADB30470.1 hypothetical protein Kfla_1368 [Kribbella flavida DSM 17836]
MPDHDAVVRARVALSYEACELAEAAAAAVPAATHELAAAAAVLEATTRYVQAVLRHARLQGTSWREISDALGCPEQQLRDQQAATGETADWWRDHLLREPFEAASDLDDWVRRHLDSDFGPAPVSGVLSGRTPYR